MELYERVWEAFDHVPKHYLTGQWLPVTKKRLQDAIAYALRQGEINATRTETWKTYKKEIQRAS